MNATARNLLPGFCTSVGVLLLVWVGLSGAASAATLAWDGTLIVNVGTPTNVSITGSGVATVNGAGGLGHLNTLRLAGGITGTSTVTATTSTALIRRVTVVETLGTGTLKRTAPSGPFAPGFAALAIKGAARVSLLTSGCVAFCFTIPLTQTGNGVGLGGSIPGAITLVGGQWTVNTATVTYTTPAASPGFATVKTTGFAHGPVSGSSSTAMGGGVIQIVTPSLIKSSLASSGTPVLTALRIKFVPEPGQMMLLIPGVIGLALLARRR